MYLNVMRKWQITTPLIAIFKYHFSVCLKPGRSRQASKALISLVNRLSSTWPSSSTTSGSLTQREVCQVGWTYCPGSSVSTILYRDVPQASGQAVTAGCLLWRTLPRKQSLPLAWNDSDVATDILTCSSWLPTVPATRTERNDYRSWGITSNCCWLHAYISYTKIH
jgi:hypothetical protein